MIKFLSFIFGLVKLAMCLIIAGFFLINGIYFCFIIEFASSFSFLMGIFSLSLGIIIFFRVCCDEFFDLLDAIYNWSKN